MSKLILYKYPFKAPSGMCQSPNVEFACSKSEVANHFLNNIDVREPSSHKVNYAPTTWGKIQASVSSFVPIFISDLCQAFV